MGRLTRWGVDHRGFKIVPAHLGRGYVRRRAVERLRRACEIPEPSAELPFGMEPLLFQGANLEPVLPESPSPPGQPIEFEPPDPRQDLDDDGEPLTEQLRHVRAPRDLSRFIAAHRAKPAPAAPARPKVLPIALSREECARCGIPGWKGCAHQAPYEPDPAPPRLPRGTGDTKGRQYL